MRLGECVQNERCRSGIRASWVWSWVLALVGVLGLALLPQSGLGASQGGAAAPASETPESKSERTLWTCSMHPQVVRDEPGSCPICGMQLTPLGARRTEQRPQESGRRIKYWWDPMMNPPYISDRPGKSPMGMDLVPVYEDEVVAGQVVVIDPRIEQNMGLRLEEVRRGPLRATVRAYAEVREPESTLRDFSLRVGGWIVRLYANYGGMHFAKGAPLFELYSPELQTAVAEWIAAANEPSIDAGVRAATRRKLEQLGVEQEQIDAWVQLQRPPETVTFRAPYAAHVVEKLVNEGARVEPGQPVLRLNDRSRMWLDAQVYEQDLYALRVGGTVQAQIVGLPGRVFQGTITFIHPHVEAPARTIVVRSELENDEGLLRQGMAATVVISSEVVPDAVLVPREAILDTGERKIAFVATDPGHFEPRAVDTGPAGADGVVSVVRGLAPGEKVVVSGQFLLDAESRLREAARKFAKPGAEGARHGGHNH